LHKVVSNRRPSNSWRGFNKYIGKWKSNCRGLNKDIMSDMASIKLLITLGKET